MRRAWQLRTGREKELGGQTLRTQERSLTWVRGMCLRVSAWVCMCTGEYVFVCTHLSLCVCMCGHAGVGECTSEYVVCVGVYVSVE